MMEWVIGAVAFWYLFLRGKGAAPAASVPSATTQGANPATIPQYGTRAWYESQATKIADGATQIVTGGVVGGGAARPPAQTAQPSGILGGVPAQSGGVSSGSSPVPNVPTNTGGLIFGGTPPGKGPDPGGYPAFVAEPLPALPVPKPGTIGIPRVEYPDFTAY